MLKCPLFRLLFLSAAPFAGAFAADDLPGVAFPSATTTLVPAATSEPVAAGQVERVTGWIRELAPECPAPAAAKAATDFMSELQASRPDLFDRIGSADFPVKDFASPLLRAAAARLVGPSDEAARAELARRRVEALAAHLHLPLAGGTAVTLAKLKAISELRFRSLAEGRMDDDDLAFYMERANDGARSAAGTTSPSGRPVGMSAAEIVSEFARRNQSGSALPHWQATITRAQLRTASGAEQRLVVLKLRPNRFRLDVGRSGGTEFVQAGDGQVFWQAVAGRPAQPISAFAMGQRRYLGEFADPLFVQEGYAFERLPDGTAAGKPYYRLAVRRADGSSYVSRIDPDSFHQVGREESGGLVIAYSDFRETAGVMVPFREDVTDAQGRQATLTVSTMLVNPGLSVALFEPADDGERAFFALERMLAAGETP